VDVSNQPILPRPGSERGTIGRQSGQSAQLGVVTEDADARQKIIAGALAGKDARPTAGGGGLPGSIQTRAASGGKPLRAVGQAFVADLKEGEHAILRWTLTPNDCYAIAGRCSTPGAAAQINLIAAPPRPPHLLAQSSAEGAEPSLGRSGGCLVNRQGSPLEVMVDMHLVRGEGRIALRIYKE
jgi:hypothetical protein